MDYISELIPENGIVKIIETYKNEMEKNEYFINLSDKYDLSYDDIFNNKLLKTMIYDIIVCSNNKIIPVSKKINNKGLQTFKFVFDFTSRDMEKLFLKYLKMSDMSFYTNCDINIKSQYLFEVIKKEVFKKIALYKKFIKKNNFFIHIFFHQKKTNQYSDNLFKEISGECIWSDEDEDYEAMPTIKKLTGYELSFKISSNNKDFDFDF